MTKERRGIIQTDKGIFKIRKNGRWQIVIAPGTKNEEKVRVTPPRRLFPK